MLRRVSGLASGLHWRAPWLAAAISIVSVPACAYWWSAECAQAERLQQLRQREAVLQPLEGQVSTRLASWKGTQAKVDSAMDAVTRQGESAEQWQRRTLTIENQRMSRSEVEQYLAELVTNEHSLFLPSTLYLKAARPQESVFTAHQGQDSPGAIIVTIKADLFTRSKP